uniref:Uncharacterized protein n=1 Tax=Oryza sativa subsp. japonica TaxID=39947 RepID=Q6Z7U4_ORYSJ|nr:hypothetical protein [Oryza sativa Japonica Group]BAD19393.1 hypothetical protein [Oryza sativa Japonica Group]
MWIPLSGQVDTLFGSHSFGVRWRNATCGGYGRQVRCLRGARHRSRRGAGVDAKTGKLFDPCVIYERLGEQWQEQAGRGGGGARGGNGGPPRVPVRPRQGGARGGGGGPPRAHDEEEEPAAHRASPHARSTSASIAGHHRPRRSSATPNWLRPPRAAILSSPPPVGIEVRGGQR